MDQSMFSWEQLQNMLDWLVLASIFYKFTITSCSIARESLSTGAAVGTIHITAICIFITGTGIRRTLIDIWGERYGASQFT